MSDRSRIIHRPGRVFEIVGFWQLWLVRGAPTGIMQDLRTGQKTRFLRQDISERATIFQRNRVFCVQECPGQLIGHDMRLNQTTK